MFYSSLRIIKISANATAVEAVSYIPVLRSRPVLAAPAPGSGSNVLLAAPAPGSGSEQNCLLLGGSGRRTIFRYKKWLKIEK